MFLIEAGDVFAERFRIEAELGHGGMGSVYKATQLTLNRIVALKVIAPQFSKNVTFRTLFDREAVTMAMLNHPNIVAVIDRSVPEQPSSSATVPMGGAPPALHPSRPPASTSAPPQWIALQFVDGSNLTGLLERLGPGGRMPVECSARATYDLLRGLEYAHGKSVVHRDIKPDNIFVSREEAQILIGDFGLAKIRAGTATASILKGTPNYTAPELMQGAAPTAQSDLWSVGVMLWELLSGQRLFGGSSFEECFRAITTIELPPLGATGAPGVEHVARRLLARDLTERYQSAAEALRDLRPYIAEQDGFRQFVRSTFGLAAAADVTRQVGSYSDPPTPPMMPTASPPPTTGGIAGQWQTTPPSMPSPTKRRSGLVVGMASAVGAAALVVVGALVLGRTGQQASTGQGDARVSAMSAHDASLAKLPPAPPPVAPKLDASAPQPLLATVTLTVTPPDATVTVDGAALAASSPHIITGVALHAKLLVHIEKPGFEPYEASIPVDGDNVTVPIQLTVKSAPARSQPVVKKVTKPTGQPTTSTHKKPPAGMEEEELKDP